MPWRLPPLNTSFKPPPAKQADAAEAVPAPPAPLVSRWRKLLPTSTNSRAYENAVWLLEAGDWENAITAFGRIVARTKRSGPLTGELARFYLCEAHLGFALSVFEAAPNDTSAAEKAISHLTEAAALAPQYADVFYHLGRIYLHHNRDCDVVTALDRTLEINPDHARARLLRGVLLYRSGEREQGLLAAEVAVSMDRTLNPAFLMDARFADAHGRYEEAVRLLLQTSEDAETTDNAVE